MSWMALCRRALLGALLSTGAAGLIRSVADVGSAPAANETVYVFIHVPKCAGTSFLRCLNTARDSSVVGQTIRGTFFPRGTVTEPSWNAKGCGTHCSIGEIHDCIDSGQAVTGSQYDPDRTESRYFTIIRHPVSRVLSEYYWWRGARDGQWPEELQMEGDLANWVRSPYNVAHNRIVKQLTATGALAPSRGSECMTLNFHKYRQYWMGRYNVDWTEGLEARINENASLVDEADRRLWFVGTQDDVKASASRMLTLLKAPQPSGAYAYLFNTICEMRSHHSVASSPGMTGLVPPDVVQEIERRNALDLALYRRHASEEPRAFKQGGPGVPAASRSWTWEEVLQGDLE